MNVTVFGIRHHGPGSARSLRRALDELEPDAVLIEGPPDADPLIPLAADGGMRPPVALLVYAAKEPGRAVFYPFASFSPEWQAIRWALARDAAVRFIDLPAATFLAEGGDGGDRGRRAERTDPLRVLAEAAGHGDPERWWEDMVEHRRDELAAFEAVADAMAAVRAELPEPDPAEAEREARREAHMRQQLRAAGKAGHERVAVVCGAWHAPALAELPPASHDAALLKGLSKTKVESAWVPWTYDRLSYRSGYGAGVTSPGWYDHLFTTEQDVLVRWLAKAARLLRDEDVPVSSAHVIEAVRLAEALAALRERPLAGLPELTEATRAVLGDGADAALALIHERLVVGEVLGDVPADSPTVPLQADLAREQRRLRLKPEASERVLDLDLRKPNDRDRSRLLHRLALLEVRWGEPEAARGKRGTFHELWRVRWDPELAVKLIEASMYGTTVAGAATAYVRERAADAGDLAGLAALIESALVADLPDAVAEVMPLLEERAALSGDVAQLMHALPPLARVVRYGSVRATDASAVADVVDGIAARVAIGLPLAAASLDDEAAERLVEDIDAVHGALAVLDHSDVRGMWEGALAAVSDAAGVHGLVAGRASRLLLDGGVLGPDEAARRMGLVLSPGAGADEGAAWIEGFLSGSGVVLLHDETLLRILDGWIAGVGADAFTSLLPVLRRTFATYPPPERRRIGERLRRLEGAAAAARAAGPVEVDRERAAAVLPLLGRILGAPAGEEERA